MMTTTSVNAPDVLVPVDELRRGDLIRREDGALMEVTREGLTYHGSVWVEAKVRLTYRFGQVVAVSPNRPAHG